MVGDKLEANGWLQGSVVQSKDVRCLLENTTVAYDESICLIIATQSCDIANTNLIVDPFIEVSVARVIAKADGNKTFNKNPRELHSLIYKVTENEEVFRETVVELKAAEKVPVRKELFQGLYPDNTRHLTNKYLESYIAWLAARYSRPALPTEFNKRIDNVDPKDKRKKKAKQLNNPLSGIYVEIIPDKEIEPDEIYNVNLLGLLAADFDGDVSQTLGVLDTYAEIMRKANMEVKTVVRKEDEISIAVIKRFKRFYYDDLSIKEDCESPVETKMNL